MKASDIRFSANDNLTFFKAGNSSELVILLHATNGNSDSLSHVRNYVKSDRPNADIWFPDLPVSLFSFEDPVEVATNLVNQIDMLWKHKKEINPGGYESIILIGHSVGALLARKIYVYCCGENDRAPFEKGVNIQQPKEWSIKVSRIILLAAINRGWSVRDLSVLDSLSIRLGIVIGNLIMSFTSRRLLVFGVRRGASFITQLRIQWLAMTRANEDGRKAVGGARVIQLLGTVDNMVSPEDNVDLITGNDFVYLEVPKSDHANVRILDTSPEGQARARVFRSALTDSWKILKQKNALPYDTEKPAVNRLVTDVIFVIHGIRDKGFWTNKIANRIKLLGKLQDKKYAIETSSYGYFPMLPFLLPNMRRANVEWLMDQYTEDLALYPNAEFSYVGHSNGTYLLAQALAEYPACHFKNVVFAGSVVPSTYDWNSLIAEGRVKSVLNYVASSDWIVAIFPNVFQKLSFLGITDIGGAGHEGFSALKDFQVQFINGSHGAAIDEAMWNDIAMFAVDGKLPETGIHTATRSTRSATVAVLAFLSPLLWLGIALILFAAGYFIWYCIWPVGEYEYAYIYRTLALITYLRLLYLILMKL